MRIRVEGHHPLKGRYRPSGNPNTAIALLAASMLTNDPVTLRNMPATTMTHAMIRAASILGANVEQTDASTLTLQTTAVGSRVLNQSDANGFVGALLYLAPMLIRRQQIRIEIDFPLNRVRTHLEALRDLGIDVTTPDGAIECSLVKWACKHIVLAQASVTATAIVMMLAAVLGKETIISNAACEPHIQELAHTLNKMGAHIEGIGSNILRIWGTDELGGTDVTIGPDHIETASVAALSVLTGGRVHIVGTHSHDLKMIEKIYRRFGIYLDMDDDEIFVPKHGTLAISNREEDVDSSIETAPWPGFPSDLVAMATVIATQARGTSLIHEKLFSNRLLFVDKLKAMGAQIILCDPHRAIVVGPTPLEAVYMDSPDVRTGMGMLGAALIADGESVIDNAQSVARTFGNVYEKLQALGAKIEIES